MLATAVLVIYGGGQAQAIDERTFDISFVNGREQSYSLALSMEYAQGLGKQNSLDGDIADIICSYPWPCEEALGVVYGNRRCPHGESTGDPWAVSEGGHLGLFQLSPGHFRTYDQDLSRWYEPGVNTYVAHKLWQDYGWQPWSCRP